MKKEAGKKSSHLTPVTLSIIVALFGLVLLIWPTISSRIISFAIASVLVLLGLFKILAYCKEDQVVVLEKWGLSVGLAALIVGVTLFFYPNWPAYLLPLVWGIVLLIGGLGKIQVGFDMFRLKLDRWWWVLVGAAISVVLGILVLANPFGTTMLLVRFIGASLVVESVLDIVVYLCFRKEQKAAAKPAN